jgi:tRNA (guanine-N7-)-methyltransferase
MSKNKLKKFAEMETFNNVFQCGSKEIHPDNPVVKLAGKWRENIFKNNNPIVLELGCGRGEYTIGLAKRYPNKNFIGIDIKGARMWAGAKEAYINHIENVAFLRINIEMIDQFFLANEIDEIWITFPDPQMKKSTKRLTSSFFMQRYQSILKNNGLIHLKTDSPFLYTYTQYMVTQNSFSLVADSQDLYSEVDKHPDATSLQTHYEKQWLQRGLTIKYLCWHLSHKECFIEPQEEIEKDTYRSYGRNYVSTTNN